MTLVLEAQETIREAAEKMAAYNMETSPELEAIYWFPAEGMIRLVMLDPVTLPNEQPNEQMVPYYFGAYPEGGVSYPYAVAVIRPEEKAVLSPPADWGRWVDAVQLWPKK